MKFIMLSGSNCIKCDMAKRLFDREKMDNYRIVDADSDEGQELAKEYRVDKLPCFIDHSTVTYSYDSLFVAENWR